MAGSLDFRAVNIDVSKLFSSSLYLNITPFSLLQLSNCSVFLIDRVARFSSLRKNFCENVWRYHLDLVKMFVSDLIIPGGNIKFLDTLFECGIVIVV